MVAACRKVLGPDRIAVEPAACEPGVSVIGEESIKLVRKEGAAVEEQGMRGASGHQTVEATWRGTFEGAI